MDSVPQEIVDEIVDRLTNNTSALKTLAITAHCFRDRAQLHLFSSISCFRSTSTQPKYRISLILANDRLAAFIQDLTIIPSSVLPDASDQLRLQALSRLRSIRFQQFPMSREILHDLWVVASRQPLQVRLTLCHCSDQFTPSSVPVLLESLELAGIYDNSQYLEPLLRCGASTLQTLALEGHCENNIMATIADITFPRLSAFTYRFGIFDKKLIHSLRLFFDNHPQIQQLNLNCASILSDLARPNVLPNLKAITGRGDIIGQWIIGRPVEHLEIEAFHADKEAIRDLLSWPALSTTPIRSLRVFQPMDTSDVRKLFKAYPHLSHLEVYIPFFVRTKHRCAGQFR